MWRYSYLLVHFLNYNFNSSNNKCKTEVDIKAMFDYMKKVNEGNCGDNDTNDCEFVLDDTHNSILNGQITENEILQAVSKLKNNKAPGYDKLCNEYMYFGITCSAIVC